VVFALPDLAPMGIALAGAAGLQLVLYFVHLRLRSANVVDAGWATSLALMGPLYALLYDGDPTRRLMIAVLVGTWGGRLAWHLWSDRVIGKPEEGRYVRLREIWGKSANLQFVWFFEAQALLAVILAIPFAYAASSTAAFGSSWDIAAIVLWFVGLVGESVADRQLAAYKKTPAARGTTFRGGLWRYSRHPNYFFEWVLWCSFAAAGSSATGGWFAWIGPALIYVFLNHITGIPPTEAQSLRSRGDEYRDYQRTTSAFFPWFPRNPQEQS